MQTTSAYKEMVKKRSELPAWKKQADILKVIRENQVTVISGMTG